MERINGYIKLHRSIREWGWYQDAVVSRVFVELLLRASYKESAYGRLKIKPGDVIVGRKALAESLGLSEQQVRTALEKLQQTGEIKMRATNTFSVVTLVNWAKYQSEDGESNQQITNKQPTDNQQPTNEQPHFKNEKNVKEGKEYTRAQAKKKTYQKPAIFGAGNYDYDEIRRRARENIRKKIGVYDETA